MKRSYGNNSPARVNFHRNFRLSVCKEFLLSLSPEIIKFGKCIVRVFYARNKRFAQRDTRSNNEIVETFDLLNSQRVLLTVVTITCSNSISCTGFYCVHNSYRILLPYRRWSGRCNLIRRASQCIRWPMYREASFARFDRTYSVPRLYIRRKTRETVPLKTWIKSPSLVSSVY